jgi:PAS domain S-box-containing protein
VKPSRLPAFTRSARFRLILLVLLAIVPALGLATYSGLDYRRQAGDKARSAAETAAHLTSQNFESLLSSAEQLLISLAQLPEVRQQQAADCTEFLANLEKQFPVYSNLAAATPQGDIFCSAAPKTGAVSVADRPYFQEVLKTHRLAVSGFLEDRITHYSIVVLAYPALDESGNLLAVAIVSLKLDALNQMASAAQLPAGSAFILMDRAGTVLISNPDSKQAQGQTYTNTAVRQAAVGSKGLGSLEANGVDGTRRLYVYLPLSSTPADSAYVIVGFPTAWVYGDADRLLERNLAGLALVALLALAAAWGLGDVLLLRQVQVMLAAAQRWTAGDLTARTRMQSGSTELVHLGQAFDEMADAIQQREGRLRLAEARYRNLVEQIPVITYTAAVETPFAFSYISPQVEGLLGESPAALTAGGRGIGWRERVHADDRARFEQGAAGFLAGEETLLIEYRVCTADGRTVWLHHEARRLQDERGGGLLVQGILQDVTARKEAEQALTARTKELARSNRELQDFVYIASHDLQEPLRKIQAFGERLHAALQGVMDEKSRDYFLRMTGAAERMQAMINDLLAYSRVTTRAQDPAPVDLNAVAGEVISDLEVSIERNHGQMEVARLPWVLGDAQQMHALLQNLIGNALKFHREGEAAVVRVYAEAGEEAGPDGEPTVRLVVADNGIGFDEKYLDRIFQPFQRLHGRAEYEGSGIGLAICAKIAEQHGGKIAANSAPGEGARFVVTLKACKEIAD